MARADFVDRKRRVAVATSDGVAIDQHLGQANNVWLFDVARDGTSELIGKRSIPSGEALNPHDWASASQLFEGVDAVLAAKAGPGASALLGEHGVLVLAVTGPVDRALTAFGRRGWILGDQPPRQGPPATGECHCQGRCKPNPEV